MLIRRALDIKSSEITDQKLYLSRRSFMAGDKIVGLEMLAGLRHFLVTG